jgi:golgi-specific brefeldin A-resistance guanine nucleotide exchange factor 1
MAYIVLVVFSRARSRAPREIEEDAWEEEVEPIPLVSSSASSSSPHAGEEAIVSIMRALSSMCNPRESSEHVCVLSLSLINIALEAGGDSLGLYPALVSVMQGDLCKHLLQNSQSSDLTILSLTLRVVFNLFNSIKDHLKVQLEVFLTSVHLRLLESNEASVSNERRELALESLLEFCHEPALMLDLYINYDCDVQVMNLSNQMCD